MSIENIFKSSRLLVLVAVVICALSSVMLYASTVNIIVHQAIGFFSAIPSSADSGKALAVGLLKVLDLLLIAITFQIIAVSLYRLFIKPVSMEESPFLNALDIANFHDLKITLIHVAVVIMVILFLEYAVQVGATLETLYLALAVTVVILSSVFASNSMKKK